MAVKKKKLDNELNEKFMRELYSSKKKQIKHGVADSKQLKEFEILIDDKRESYKKKLVKKIEKIKSDKKLMGCEDKEVIMKYEITLLREEFEKYKEILKCIEDWIRDQEILTVDEIWQAKRILDNKYLIRRMLSCAEIDSTKEVISLIMEDSSNRKVYKTFVEWGEEG